MPVTKFLLFVNSRPTAVSKELWREWYTTEHIPDLIQHKVAKRAVLYEEVLRPSQQVASDRKPFLVLYETEFENAMAKAMTTPGVRGTSEMFRRENKSDVEGSDRIPANGEFDVRNYELLQEFDPRGLGDVPPTDLLTIEMQPVDLDDCDKWYREEHLALLAKTPGYRRGLRYKAGVPLPTAKEAPFVHLAVHEYDDLAAAVASPEAVEADGTAWAKKIFEGSKIIGRVWKRVYDQGFRES